MEMATKEMEASKIYKAISNFMTQEFYQDTFILLITMRKMENRNYKMLNLPLPLDLISLFQRNFE